MTVSHNPEDERFDRVGSTSRLVVDAGRLWAGGLAAAAVSALAAAVGVLVVRGLLKIEFLAPERAGMWGDSTTWWLVIAAGVAALAATALLHVLLLTAPEPFKFFHWIVGLVTVAVALAPFLTGAGLATKLASAGVYVLVGVAIGSLVGGAGARSIRRTAPHHRR